jgi:hypothetical protein
VPLGGHKDLGGLPADTKAFDFIALSYDYGEREHKMNMTRAAGFSIAPNTFDLAERDSLLSRSHYGLSLHQTPVPIIEPPRYVLFACWRLPIVAESVVNPFPYAIIPWDPACKALLAMPAATIQKVVDHNYKMVTDKYSFRNCVERGVQRLQDLQSGISRLKRNKDA